jgi:hypothetical protein
MKRILLFALFLIPINEKVALESRRSPAAIEQFSCSEKIKLFFPSRDSKVPILHFDDKSNETAADLIWTHYIELFQPPVQERIMGLPPKFSEIIVRKHKVRINDLPFVFLEDNLFYHAKSKLPYIINDAKELEEIPSSLMLIYYRMRARNSISAIAFQNKMMTRKNALFSQTAENSSVRVSKIRFHRLETKNSYFPQYSLLSENKKILEDLADLSSQEIKKIIMEGDFKETIESGFAATYNRSLRLLSEYDLYEKTFMPDELGFKIIERVKKDILGILEEELSKESSDSEELFLMDLIRKHLEDLKSGKRLLFIGGPESLITDSEIYSHASRSYDRTKGLSYWQVMAQKAHTGADSRYLSLSSDLSIAKKFAKPAYGSSSKHGKLAIVLVDKNRSNYNFFNEMWGFEEWEHTILDKIERNEIIEIESP